MPVTQISAVELNKEIQSDKKLLLLDVRENNEFEFARIEGSLHIPMNQIPARINEIPANETCVVICHHGIRSQQVALYLDHSGVTDIYNLTGGVDAWSLACDNTVQRY